MNVEYTDVALEAMWDTYPHRLAWLSKVTAVQRAGYASGHPGVRKHDFFSAVWHLRDREQDLRNADRKNSLTCKLQRALHASCVIFALLVSCPYMQAAKIANAAESYDITDDARVKVGDIYDPSHGRRLQIRDNDNRIIGYIEDDGDVTDTRRRKKKEIEFDDD